MGILGMPSIDGTPAIESLHENQWPLSGKLDFICTKRAIIL
jgi:hypothetical protein